MVHLRISLFLLLFVACCFRAASQSNPTPTSCGLPAEGDLRQDVTYTLSANCQLTGSLQLQLSVTVTVLGKGFTITGRDQHEALFIVYENATLTIQNATLDGTNIRRGQLIDAVGTLTLTNVTMRRSYRSSAVRLPGTGTFTNVLFEDHNAVIYGGEKTASALHIHQAGTATVTNAVFRGNYGGGGAVVIHKSGSNSGSLTTNGCLSFAGNVPYDIQNRGAVSKWTKNHSGDCSGTIGNGDAAVTSPPAMLSCGIPGRGNLDSTATYTLSGDCSLGATGRGTLYWHIGEGVKITINGNGYTINGATGTNYASVRTAVTSELVLNNVQLNRVFLHVFGTLKATNGAFAWVNTRALWLDGTADLKNVIFHDNSSSSAGLGTAIVASSVFGKGIATVTNGVFRNNKGTHATNPSHPLFTYHGSYTQTAKIILINTATFDGNSPSDKNWQDSSNVDDQTGGKTVPPGVVVGPYQVGVFKQEDDGSARGNSGPRVDAAGQPGGTCWQRLGSIGLICHRRDRYDKPAISILRIDSNSRGHYVLGVTQWQIEAKKRAGLVASTADGRVAVYVLGPGCVKRDEHRENPRVISEDCVAAQMTRLRELARSGSDGNSLGWERYIAVAKGPNAEGKAPTIVFDNALDGRAVGTVGLRIGEPGISAPARAVVAPQQRDRSKFAVAPQAAAPDGSQWHIVQPGETLLGIAIAYGVSMRELMRVNVVEDASYIQGGQNLLIRQGG